jgi:hypothetical protein
MTVTIRKTDYPQLWIIGTIDAGRTEFTPLRNCASADEAMAWLSYLNGGEHPGRREVAAKIREAFGQGEVSK